MPAFCIKLIKIKLSLHLYTESTIALNKLVILKNDEKDEAIVRWGSYVK